MSIMQKNLTQALGEIDRIVNNHFAMAEIVGGHYLELVWQAKAVLLKCKLSTKQHTNKFCHTCDKEMIFENSELRCLNNCKLQIVRIK